MNDEDFIPIPLSELPPLDLSKVGLPGETVGVFIDPNDLQKLCEAVMENHYTSDYFAGSDFCSFCRAREHYDPTTQRRSMHHTEDCVVPLAQRLYGELG